VLLDVVEYGQALGLDMSYGDHEDAPGPARAQLPLRPCGAHGGQHLDLPSDLRGGRPQARAASDLHAQAVHRRGGQRPHHHFSLVDDDGNNVFHDPDGPATLSEVGATSWAALLEHFQALMCVGNPTVNSYCRMWDTGFWAPIYRNWGWQNRTCTVRVAGGGRFEYRGVDSSCNPT
jgi:glutamine synthetase